MVKVKNVMKDFVITVHPALTLDAVAKIMVNNRVGSVVVIDKKRPVGIVTSEDIVSLVAKGKSAEKVKVKDIKSKSFITASPDDDLIRVTKVMVKEGVKRIPIVKDGELLGILTDKEILITTPELIGILSEKLKARVEKVARRDEVISGICEQCEGYDDHLHLLGGRWMCEDCRN